MVCFRPRLLGNIIIGDSLASLAFFKLELNAVEKKEKKNCC